MVDSARDLFDSPRSRLTALADLLASLLPEDCDFVLVLTKRSDGGGWTSYVSSLEVHEIQSIIEVSRQQADASLRKEQG